MNDISVKIDSYPGTEHASPSYYGFMYSGFEEEVWRNNQLTFKKRPLIIMA